MIKCVNGAGALLFTLLFVFEIVPDWPFWILEVLILLWLGLSVRS
jgi:hypothetical protein